MTNHKMTLIVTLWALIMLSALLYNSTTQLSTFDPDMKLAQAASSADFDDLFSAQLKAAGVGPGSIVHLQSAHRCYCNSLAQPHQQELQTALSPAGYHLTKVSLDKQPQLKQYISQYPAIAVVDLQGHLRYLGPYAIGLGCFSGSNLVAEISHLATAKTYLGAQINSDAKGCFCSA